MDAKKGNEMEKKRPVGVTFYSVISMVFYGLGFLAFALGGLLQAKSIWELLLVLFLFVCSISIMISGIFIIQLKNWARILFLLQMGLICMIGLLSFRRELFTGSIGNDFWFFSLLTILPASAIFYLTRYKVKEQFK